MNLCKASVSCAILLLLAGCASRAERMVARHGEDCTASGFTADTDPWRQCVITLEQQRLSRIGIGFHGIQALKPAVPMRCSTLNNVTTCR